MAWDEVMARVYPERRVSILSVTVGKSLRAHSHPSHIMSNGWLVRDVTNYLLNERIARHATDVSIRNEAWPNDFVLPASKSFTLEQMVIERTNCDTVGVDKHPAFR